MKLFLSWSGETSHRVALALRDWIPNVLQTVIPYVSSMEIEKGRRWGPDIAKELEESSYGIICITAGNQQSRWLNFEAGALSKVVDDSYVAPFLLNLKKSQLQSPLSLFQATTFEEADFRKLVYSINTANKDRPLTSVTLDRVFNMWWPSLEEKLQEIVTQAVDEPPIIDEQQTTTGEENSKILEELLELARSQSRILEGREESRPIINTKIENDYVKMSLSREESRKRYEFSTTLSRLKSDQFSILGNLESMMEKSNDKESLAVVIEIVKAARSKVDALDSISSGGGFIRLT